MRLTALVDEDFVNYKKPSMFLGTSFCNWKCCIEQGCDLSMCQNSSLAHAEIIEESADNLIKRYINNPITHAVVIGGLEPFDTLEDLSEFIPRFRKVSDDDIVIYTGYTEDEIYSICKDSTGLKKYSNIIVKFGRYVPNQKKHYDDTLGVYLASDNQYGKRF